MVMDYDLDGQLTPEEINGKLSLVVPRKKEDAVGQKEVDYRKKFPPATAESNY